MLHKFAWPKNASYAEICMMYVRHVSSSYGRALVVFDGYHGSSTKDEAHRRRTGNDVGATTHHADATDMRENMYMVTSKRTVCITTLKKHLDPALSEALLFMHALSGCDTTSRPYGIGKVTILTKYTSLRKSTSVFMSPCSSKEDIEKAGEEAMPVIYGCTTSPTLCCARVSKFQLKVATSAGYVTPEKLPPTTDAAALHSHRTYHQVQVWRGNNMAPDGWGWRVSSAGRLPIRMTQPAAPERLLKIIRCNCSGKCDKKTCTCRKNGLQCTPACGQCKGITCINVPQVESQDDDDDQDQTGF